MRGEKLIDLRTAGSPALSYGQSIWIIRFSYATYSFIGVSTFFVLETRQEIPTLLIYHKSQEIRTARPRDPFWIKLVQSTAGYHVTQCLWGVSLEDNGTG